MQRWVERFEKIVEDICIIIFPLIIIVSVSTSVCIWRFLMLSSSNLYYWLKKIEFPCTFTALSINNFQYYCVLVTILPDMKRPYSLTSP